MERNESTKHPSEITTWPTIREAEAHGWRRPRDIKNEIRPGLHVVDISGPNSFGYDFGICNIDDWENNAIVASKSLYFTDEKNQIGKMGAIAAMFHLTDARRAKPSLSAKIAAQKNVVENLKSQLAVAMDNLAALENSK